MPLDLDLQSDPYTARGPDSTQLVDHSWNEAVYTETHKKHAHTYTAKALQSQK